MGKLFSAPLIWVALILSLSSPTMADDGGCNPNPARVDDNPTAFTLKIAALASILAAGALGVLLPLMGKKFPFLNQNGNPLFIVKSFAAGVIISTGFVHVLPDAFESLTSPCLKDRIWGEFPFAGFVAMMSAIITLVIESSAMSYCMRGKVAEIGRGDEESLDGHGGEVHYHTHASHGHAHGAVLPPLPKEDSVPEQIRHRVISQVLELGILVHSLIIGISLGASSQPSTIRPLVGALSFHQFFEGLGLGGCIAQANFKGRVKFLMALLFSLTTPIGVALGMGVASKYKENGDGALILEGILNSASAGILIYMALVDFLAVDFKSPKLRSHGLLQLAAYLALFLGTGLMSLLAKWA